MNKNVPNILCLIRIALAPFVVLLLTVENGGAACKIAALVVFSIAMLTDLFDGKIARKYGFVSDMGKFLDPIADKLLVLGTMIAFVQINVFPAFPVVLILARELAVTGLRLIAAPKGEVIAANMAGKAKTASQSVCLIAVFLLLLFVPGDVLHLTALILIWICAAIAVFSAIPYFQKGSRYLKN